MSLLRQIFNLVRQNDGEVEGDVNEMGSNVSFRVIFIDKNVSLKGKGIIIFL